MNAILAATESSAVTPAERQELVDRIAASVELRRAARLRSFLVYVCDRTLNDGVSVIHEQEIGAAVFGRPAQYDTGIDNIVRVNATELRKRLEHYFADEGAGEEVVLEIQRGSYTPAFHRRVLAEAPVAESMRSASTHTAGTHTAGTHAAGTAGEGAKGGVDSGVSNEVAVSEIETTPRLSEHADAEARGEGGRRSLRWWQVATGLLALSCGGLGWQNHQLTNQLQPWRRDPALRAFWGEFFSSGAETDILLADTSFALAEDMMQRSVSLSDYLNYSYKQFAESANLPAAQRNDLRLVLQRNNGSIADFRVGQQVLALDSDPHRMTLKFAREYTPDAAKHNSLVLIGSRESNPWVDLFAGKLNFDLQYDPTLGRPYIVNQSPQPGEAAKYFPVSSGGQAATSYAVIAYLPNLSGKGKTLIIEGCDSQATGAAGDFMTSGDSLAALEQTFPAGKIPSFEVLLRTSQLSGTPLHSEVIAYRIDSGAKAKNGAPGARTQ